MAAGHVTFMYVFGHESIDAPGIVRLAPFAREPSPTPVYNPRQRVTSRPNSDAHRIWPHVYVCFIFRIRSSFGLFFLIHRVAS
jgi:hypothetical protein